MPIVSFGYLRDRERCPGPHVSAKIGPEMYRFVAAVAADPLTSTVLLPYNTRNGGA